MFSAVILMLRQYNNSGRFGGHKRFTNTGRYIIQSIHGKLKIKTKAVAKEREEEKRSEEGRLLNVTWLVFKPN